MLSANVSRADVSDPFVSYGLKAVR